MLFEPQHQRAQIPGRAIEQTQRLSGVVDIADAGKFTIPFAPARDAHGVRQRADRDVLGLIDPHEDDLLSVQQHLKRIGLRGAAVIHYRPTS